MLKGVSYVTDSNNKKIAVQIDLKVLQKYDEDVEDRLMALVRNQERVRNVLR